MGKLTKAKNLKPGDEFYIVQNGQAKKHKVSRVSKTLFIARHENTDLRFSQETGLMFGGEGKDVIQAYRATQRNLDLLMVVEQSKRICSTLDTLKDRLSEATKATRLFNLTFIELAQTEKMVAEALEIVDGQYGVS